MNSLTKWWQNRALQSLVNMKPQGEERAEKQQRQRNRIQRIARFSCENIETLLIRCQARIVEVEGKRFEDPGYSDAMSDSLHNIQSLLQNQLRICVQGVPDDSSASDIT
jgi:hypothetical protein